MGKDNRQKLRELAEELANVEANIFVLRDFSPGNPRHEQKEAAQIGNPPKNGMTSWIAGTVAAALLLPPVALYTGYRAYQANKVYKKKLQEWQDDQKVQNNLKEMVIHQENRRKEILEDIQKLCAADPTLDKNYWWKAKEVTPTMGDAVEALLPGKEVTVGEWQFGLLHQFWTVESGAYLYLLDMKKYSVNLCAKDAIEMADPANSKVIYKNDRLLNGKAEGFRLMHFYAYHVEPIQEVRKSTVRTAVDKEAERSAYQRKLDIQESILNGIGSRNFMTDEEMQLTGRIGTGEYVDRNLVRGMFEADFEQKLAARGDYEEHSTYSKGFRGLSSIALYNCADVLISLDPATDGQCAAVLVPREEQHIMRLTVRSVEKDNPFVGRLERYGDLPEFEVLDEGGAPSIKMAVDLIANPDMCKLLQLQNRDVLEEKPDLDKCEHAYLIWKDNPKSRAS